MACYCGQAPSFLFGPSVCPSCQVFPPQATPASSDLSSDLRLWAYLRIVSDHSLFTALAGSSDAGQALYLKAVRCPTQPKTIHVAFQEWQSGCSTGLNSQE